MSCADILIIMFILSNKGGAGHGGDLRSDAASHGFRGKLPAGERLAAQNLIGKRYRKRALAFLPPSWNLVDDEQEATLSGKIVTELIWHGHPVSGADKADTF
jgi:hypothetical protein